jgi:hypothetical protein
MAMNVITKSRSFCSKSRLVLLAVCASLMLPASGASSLGAAEVTDKVDRPSFLARHDMVWTRLPDRWGSGAFMGNGLLGAKILPNTLYTESGPCIETPLSGAASLHDMLLTSWGGKIRVFPAVPAAWHDVTFHNLRAEGAFLVSAVRKNDKLQFIRIESLAGEPCRVVTDMPHPAATGFQIKQLADRDYELDLKKGQTAILTPGGTAVEAAIAPVSPQKERENFYGLH